MTPTRTLEVAQSDFTLSPFSPAWKRVEEHYGAACRFGRQAVEEAWHCGDALIAAKAETKHGDWLPALKAVEITHDVAKRLMLLRRKYSEIVQIAPFDSVSAALQLPQAEQHKPLEPNVRDPQPIFDVFKQLEALLPGPNSEVGLHFYVWFVNGDGINQWMAVLFSVRSYASAIQAAIKGVGQENHLKLCRDADNMRQSTILILNQYIDQARALALKDAQERVRQGASA